MTKLMLIKLAILANDAKAVHGEAAYPLSNIVFAVVADHADVLNLETGLETQDPSGSSFDDAYYDVVWVSTTSEEDRLLPLKGETLMVLPAPMLSGQAATWLIKRAADNGRIDERDDDVNEYTDYSDKSERGVVDTRPLSYFLEVIRNLVSEGEAKQCTNSILSKSAQEEAMIVYHT